MRNNAKKMIMILAGTEGNLFLAFLLCCVFRPRFILLGGILYGAGTVILFGIGYYAISKQVNETMRKVDDTIQSLIDNEPVENFNVNEDDLTGKFQMQIMKFHDMLRFYEEREKNLRNQLSSLISDLVHQINTPLMNIQMYCGFLEERDLDEDTRKTFLNYVNQQVHKLSWFGEGFGKVSRLETDVMQFHCKVQPILPILLKAIDQITLKAEQKKNEIVLKGNQKAEACYDSRWTEEAVFNVLDNAVKYGAAKMPIVVRLESYDLYSRVDITNYGSEIPKTEYNKIFQRFYRGKNDNGQEGVGLGLYLAREIIGHQKGYMKVMSEQGKTRFSIFLLKKNVEV